jgi:hypothetical protein
MDYGDNPIRPVTHFWFGPMTLLDFMGNYNQNRFWWPGTCHEAPTFQTKLGIQAALNDMKINHPNDSVALIFFSRPTDDQGNQGFYNRVRVPVSRDYTRMNNCLWFAPQSIDTPSRDIRPYDSDSAIDDVPRARGGTCYPFPLYLAYNQFSSNPALQTWNPSGPVGEAGGNGRIGSQKLIIFETDGMVNTTAAANFTDNGPHQSFYNVRIGQTNEYPSGVYGDSATATTQAYDATDRICALESDPLRGYSTARKPVLIHCLAFGSLFEPSNTSSYKDNALAILQNLQYKGGQAGGEQIAPDTPLAPYKIIVGPFNQRINNMKNAFTVIMDDGMQVTLIQ